MIHSVSQFLLIEWTVVVGCVYRYMYIILLQHYLLCALSLSFPSFSSLIGGQAFVSSSVIIFVILLFYSPLFSTLLFIFSFFLTSFSFGNFFRIYLLLVLHPLMDKKIFGIISCLTLCHLAYPLQSWVIKSSLLYVIACYLALSFIPICISEHLKIEIILHLRLNHRVCDMFLPSHSTDDLKVPCKCPA